MVKSTIQFGIIREDKLSHIFHYQTEKVGALKDTFVSIRNVSVNTILNLQLKLKKKLKKTVFN